jgi:sporulation-control protein
VVFKKMMRAFGADGPSVDTVLANPNTRPGLTLGGQVQVASGDHDVTIEHIALSLVTRVESGHTDEPAEFFRVPISGPFGLPRGERRDIPFSFPVPWETPVTDVYGQRLPGMTMGLRTEVGVARTVDRGDLDEVAIHPLPAQERILDAFAALGFRFARADLEHGAIYGLCQELPFYQEIEFYPPPHMLGAFNEVELTFIADPAGVEVILEFDKRGGFLTPGHDAYGRFRVPHNEADTADWRSVVDEWLHEAAGHYQGLRAEHGYPAPDAWAGQGSFPGPGAGVPNDGVPGGYGYGPSQGYGSGHGYPPHYGYHAGDGYRSGEGYRSGDGYRSGPGHHSVDGYQSGPGYQSGAAYPSGAAYSSGDSYPPGDGYWRGDGYQAGGDPGRPRGGLGMGAMAAGVAGGVLGGLVLGEVVEEVFEDDSADAEE